MAGRHGRARQFPVGDCFVCTFPVDVAESTIVRPGELPFGPPMHEECYRADLIIFGASPDKESWSDTPEPLDAV